MEDKGNLRQTSRAAYTKLIAAKKAAITTRKRVFAVIVGIGACFAWGGFAAGPLNFILPTILTGGLCLLLLPSTKELWLTQCATSPGLQAGEG